ncbi:MAG: cytochrome c maturation protein CcmE [Acidobacteriota bacterium]|nr:cytochrome c maturation protein CcmE [Acidobacteriota bacterium]MDH3785451.1 cytochrome c maturation protein CcmE [Acidobacteriota bacterium]
MEMRKIKFVVIGAGVFLSLAFLIMVGMNRPGGMAYYMTVTEYLAEGATESDFRVNGKVVEGSIERFTSGQDVRFTMTDGVSVMTVSYHGIIPDTFVDRADVVVQGSMSDQNEFDAHKLLAKCPSKYEVSDEYTTPEDYEPEVLAPEAVDVSQLQP